MLTCSCGHHSLLLDSRDYWNEAIENGKPPQLQCKCKSKIFSVSLFYTFRTNSEEVSQVDVVATCARCGLERHAMTVEINGGPTDLLIDRPLDPCDQPWLRARHVKLSAIWNQKDLESFIHSVMGLDGACAYVMTIEGSVTTFYTEKELISKLRLEPLWFLYFCTEHIPFPPNPFATWRDLPVIQVWSPKVIVDKNGTVTTMYLLEYAKEVIQGAIVVPQPCEFLDFTKTITTWLRNNFSSERGKGAFDNPEEFGRVREWW